MKSKRARNIVSKIARIWSILSIIFILIFFVGSLFDSKADNTNSTTLFNFIFFPIGLSAGLLLAWKWEFAGGLIAVVSIILFHIFIETEFVLFIELLAVPGLLFLLLGIFSKKNL